MRVKQKVDKKDKNSKFLKIEEKLNKIEDH